MASSLKSRWKRARWRRSPAVPVLGLLWLTIVTAFLMWQSISYRGIAFSAVEMQYAQFGQAFPVLTLVPLIFLLGLPGLLLLWVRLPRKVAHADAVLPELSQAVAAELRLLRILVGGAGLLLLLALGVLLASLFEPDANGPAQTIDPRTTVGEPSAGHARLAGTVLFERTATFEQDVLFLHRPIRFAPLAAPSDQPIRYFVEITPERLEMLKIEGATATFDGIMQRGALPGPVEQLFRYAGFRVATPHYVLFASKASVRMPMYVMALNALVAAVCLALLAVFQRHRLRKARHKAVEERDPAIVS